MDTLQQYQPYFKYVLFLIWIIMFFIINRTLIKDKELRKWVMSSLSTDNNIANGSSGKSLSAFITMQVVIFASLVAVVYTNDHLLPEYMYITLVTFVASLYGIKMASKSKRFSSSTDVTTSDVQTEVEKPKEESTGT